MVSGESPAVARRRLRLELRKARETKGLTQGHVARTLEWSLSKVNRIEAGDVTVSNTDLHALINLFGITDEAEADRLLEYGRISRRRGWWDDPRHREHLTPPTMQLLQFESEASAIRVFQPTLIPGLLQIQQYAEAVMNFWQELSQQTRDGRTDIRMRRRDQVFNRSDPPDYLLILDESVLSREVGGQKVMAEQLRELFRLVEMPQIRARIVPLTAGAALAQLGSFTIFDLGDEENAVLYRESSILDEIVHSADAIGRHRRIFEQMWERSWDEGASARLIDARAADMLSSLDRRQPG